MSVQTLMPGRKFHNPTLIANILHQVTELAQAAPVITMGAAVHLLCGAGLPVESDLDLILPADSRIFDDVRSTTNGIYSGKKKILTIQGVTVELLADFVATPTKNGERQSINFRYFPFADFIRIDEPFCKTGENMFPVTSLDTLVDFYTRANREKDQEKLKLLIGYFRRNGMTIPHPLTIALGGRACDLTAMNALIKLELGKGDFRLERPDPVEHETHVLSDSHISHAEIMRVSNGDCLVVIYSSSIDEPEVFFLRSKDVFRFGGNTYMAWREDTSDHVAWNFIQEA